jgi:hypothetical protein
VWYPTAAHIFYSFVTKSSWYCLLSHLPSSTQSLTSSEITIHILQTSIHPLTETLITLLTARKASNQGSNLIEYTLGDQENKDDDQGLALQQTTRLRRR